MSASRMRALVERSLDLITVLTPDLTVLYQSPSAERILGRAPAEIEGRRFSGLVHRVDLRALRVACAEALDGVIPRPVAVRLRRGDGSWVEAETLVRFDAEEGQLVFATRDAGLHARAARRQHERSGRQDLIVRLGARALAGEELPALMRAAVTGLRELLRADHAVVLRRTSTGGLEPGAQAGHAPRVELWALGEDARSLPAAALAAPAPVIVKAWGEETRFTEADQLHAGELESAIAVAIPGCEAPFGVLVLQSRAPVHFGHDEGVAVQALANVLAGAQRRVLDEERLRHQALHDSVTGLPNRVLFEDRVARALASAVRHGRRLAVLELDLDSFKLVREGLGYAGGDELLRAFARRVGDCVRAEDTLARVGVDGFAVLLPELGGEEDVLRVVHRITAALERPLEVSGREIVTSAAIGIALNEPVPTRQDAATILRDADLAMHAAKARGPASYEFYAGHMHDAAVRALELTADLYQALERGELAVHFQPIVSLRDDSIVGTEALVRWEHPRHGLLSPGVFLPIAEETGLIVPLGRFVLRTACVMLRRWQQAGLAARRLSVSVNLGRQQLAAPDLTDDVRAVLAATRLDPNCLILEITEDVLLAREGMRQRLGELKALGVRLAVDDFGTGYSALSHLQRYPIDIIKIDKAFVDGIEDSDDHPRLIRGIIELTHSLGLHTVAEGIETSCQAQALRAMGSELGQGFHFARPLPSRDLEALLAAGSDGLGLAVELGS